MTEQDKNRAEFEKWASAQNWIVHRDSFGDYVYSTARDGWAAWQAARALHSELKPVTHLIDRHAFSVSPHGQDAEGHSWLEEAHSPDEKGALAVYSSSQVMEMMRRYKDTLDGSSA